VDLVERQADGANLRHPWEQARRTLVGEVVRDTAAARGLELRDALDIGSGDAWLAKGLADDLGLRHVDALDIGYSDADIVELTTDVVSAVRETPDRTYDAAFLLDVIEHVPDDQVLLRLAHDHVSPDGLVMVSVPAWPRMATQHDVALGHYRRYTPARLRSALAGAGLREIALGGAFGALLPVRAVQRVVEQRRGARELPNLGTWQGGELVTSAVTSALTWDARLGRALAGRGVPAPGLSVWAIAVRADAA
jgi:SAM-dependent methyltransferase